MYTYPYAHIYTYKIYIESIGLISVPIKQLGDKHIRVEPLPFRSAFRLGRRLFTTSCHCLAVSVTALAHSKGSDVLKMNKPLRFMSKVSPPSTSGSHSGSSFFRNVFTRDSQALSTRLSRSSSSSSSSTPNFLRAMSMMALRVTTEVLMVRQAAMIARLISRTFG